MYWVKYSFASAVCALIKHAYCSEHAVCVPGLGRHRYKHCVVSVFFANAFKKGKDLY